LGKGRLNSHHRLRLDFCSGGVVAQQSEDLGDVLHIFGPRLLALGVGLNVIIAVWQAEPAGAGEGDYAVGVGEVLVGAEAEQRAGLAGL
jgi:hypothetical protein